VIKTTHLQVLRLRHQLEKVKIDENAETSDYTHLSKTELCDRLNTVKDALVKQNESNAQLKLDNQQLREQITKMDYDNTHDEHIDGYNTVICLFFKLFCRWQAF
jgi:hypothetical protein